MSSLQPFEEKLAQCFSPDRWQSAGAVLAVSGGADSVALLRAMAGLCGADRCALRVSHLNHLLRGAESNRDEKFVVDLCRELAVPCDVERTDMTAEAQRLGESIETASRKKRYAFFQKIAQQHGVGYVVTAHTADDQVETILHRIVRGTGLSGLSGIPRVRALGPAVALLRPLLDFRRVEIINYLESLEQPYCQDASNMDLVYTRNRIRHELLPLLRHNYNPGVDDALLRLGTLAAELGQWIEPEIQRLLAAAVQFPASGGASIDCRRLAATDRFLVRELMVAVWNERDWPRQSMGFAEWEALRSMAQDFAAGTAPARTLPGGISARRSASTLTLAPPAADLT